MKNEKKRSVGKNKKKKTNLETGKQSKQEKFKKREKATKTENQATGKIGKNTKN